MTDYQDYIPRKPIYGVIRAKRFSALVILYYDDKTTVSMSSGGLELTDQTLPKFAINAKRPIDLNRAQNVRISIIENHSKKTTDYARMIESCDMSNSD